MNNNWEAKYQEYKNVWGIEAEHTLLQYEKLVESGPILDIGIGEGRNVLSFALKGNHIEGIDISKTAIKRSEDRLLKLNSSFDLNCCDVRGYDFKDNYYSLIISAWTLNFMKKSELIDLLSKMKNSIKDKGSIYIGMFSKSDPKYRTYKDELQEIEDDTFYHPKRDTYINYIDKEELLSHFQEDFELITIKEDYSLELDPGNEHYHGAFELIIRKKTS